MRLATFNMLHGRSLADGRVDGERLAGVMAGLDADVLALQEVDRLQVRSGQLDLTAVAASALGAAGHRFAAAVVGTPGEVYRPSWHDDDAVDEPNYGIGLVSRYPVRSWQVLRLRSAPVRSPIFVPGPGNGLLLLRDEPRVALIAVLDTPYGDVTVAGTHLSFVPGWNVRQLRLVTRALRRFPAPRLLLGDLNVPGRMAGVASGWRMLGRLPTYPSPMPKVQLDHVLADPRGAGALPPVTAVSAPETPISDHRPLVVQLGD